MKKTIVGALIIGGLIGGAILLSDQDKLHRINGTQDMVWVSDDLHMNVQDGNKRKIIKKIKKSKDGTQDMALFSDDVLMDVQDGNKHVVIKHIGKSNDLESDHHASKKIFVIKMGSGEHDVEVDVKATLEKLKEEMDSVDWEEVAAAVAESIKELDIDVNVQLDSDELNDSTEDIAKTITEAVSEAVEGISGKSGKIKIEIKVNEEVTEIPSESTE
ncbi:MAG: hypothetical protein NZ709_01995 [Candidatus Marinimicrobia bacterium]|nr:hypothetical protein [Candidatus Neomarinimicrobiota bacterium]